MYIYVGVCECASACVCACVCFVCSVCMLCVCMLCVCVRVCVAHFYFGAVAAAFAERKSKIVAAFECILYLVATFLAALAHAHTHMHKTKNTHTHSHTLLLCLYSSHSLHNQQRFMTISKLNQQNIVEFRKKRRRNDISVLAERFPLYGKECRRFPLSQK